MRLVEDLYLVKWQVTGQKKVYPPSAIIEAKNVIHAIERAEHIKVYDPEIHTVSAVSKMNLDIYVEGAGDLVPGPVETPGD